MGREGRGSEREEGASEDDEARNGGMKEGRSRAACAGGMQPEVWLHPCGRVVLGVLPFGPVTHLRHSCSSRPQRARL